MANYGPDKLVDKKVGLQNGVPQGYGYPTGAGYAALPTGPPMQTYAGYPPAAYGYPQGPPPPYSVAVNQPQAAGIPGYPGYASFPYPYGIPMQPAMGPTTVMMPGGYDGGARFDGIARPGIPPPPPGVMPNAAQMAMLQGNSAIVTQQKGNFLSGAGSDGGYTFW